MSIDRALIAFPTPTTGAVPSTAPSSPPFAMHEVAAPLDDAPPARLGVGPVDFTEFVQRKIEAATEHLRGLSSTKLKLVREHLRVNIESDPALVTLVLAATGSIAGPSLEQF
jgi:hypothetical protein